MWGFFCPQTSLPSSLSSSSSSSAQHHSKDNHSVHDFNFPSRGALLFCCPTSSVDDASGSRNSRSNKKNALEFVEDAATTATTVISIDGDYDDDDDENIANSDNYFLRSELETSDTTDAGGADPPSQEEIMSSKHDDGGFNKKNMALQSSGGQSYFLFRMNAATGMVEVPDDANLLEWGKDDCSSDDDSDGDDVDSGIDSGDEDSSRSSDTISFDYSESERDDEMMMMMWHVNHLLGMDVEELTFLMDCGEGLPLAAASLPWKTDVIHCSAQHHDAADDVYLSLTVSTASDQDDKENLEILLLKISMPLDE